MTVTCSISPNAVSRKGANEGRRSCLTSTDEPPSAIFRLFSGDRSLRLFSSAPLRHWAGGLKLHGG